MENKNVNQIEIERQKINNLDQEIVKLLDARFEIAKTIAEIKNKLGMQIFQANREQEVLERVSKISKSPESVQNIFKTIMQESKKVQEKIT